MHESCCEYANMKHMVRSNLPGVDPSMPIGEYLSTEKVAALKGVSTITVRTAIRRGTLRGFQDDGRVRVLRLDAEAWEPMLKVEDRVRHAANVRWHKEEGAEDDKPA